MTELTLPSLADLGIVPGSFIRKLDNRNHWNAYKDETDAASASLLIAAKVFKDKGNIYSLWWVYTDQEFYGVVALLTENATPRDRKIDFIWILEHELQEVGIACRNVSEGSCLHVENLHFDAEIDSGMAQQLCHILWTRNREAKRCLKENTIQILEHQQNLGCKATETSLENCECETW
ncbi:MAG: hypothetical protein F6K30_30835 [Cyanothece sp. SIO2G6]|nr:hypothetical protein [Cyanothece sp. SIO2G6]